MQCDILVAMIAPKASGLHFYVKQINGKIEKLIAKPEKLIIKESAAVHEC